MDRELKPDELEAEYVTSLGPELGRVFCALHNELAWLHLKWEQYTELYGTKPKRIEILNASAPVFFRVVQDALWEDTLMHLSRLTDPAQSPGKGDRRNLSVNALADLIGDKEIKAVVARLAQAATDSAAFARDWRNRRLAHRALALALAEPVAPLAPASHSQVNTSLAALRSTLNAVDTHFRDTTVAYELGGHPGGAQSVLRKLHLGIEASKARMDRLRSGKPLPEDLAPRNAV